MLAPLKLGAAGTYALNRRLKQRLNPGVGREAELGVSVGDQAHMHIYAYVYVYVYVYVYACTCT